MDIMKKPELLAPAGDYTCFQAALKAGADAVYIGGQRFGARAYAGNLSLIHIFKSPADGFPGKDTLLHRFSR